MDKERKREEEKFNDNEQLALKIAEELSEGREFECSSLDIYDGAMKMADWKDKEYKTAYVVTRSDLYYDEVEKVFFDEKKAEEYCKFFNEDENSDHRNITKIEVTL